ncbi:MAG: hypothetical protein JW778_04935 [Candidatus Altiarchaeota archaeon]|nr:hypothetical protein [Candidatus Altiarchaeota archaeon]
MSVNSLFRVLFHPSDSFFYEGSEASLGGAVRNIMLAVILVSLICGGLIIVLVLVLGVVAFPFMFGQTGALIPSLLLVIPYMILSILVAGLLMVIILFIESFILFVTSRILGGGGDFTTQTYYLSMIEAVFILISPITSILSLIPLLSIIVLLYYLFLITIALKEAHGYGIIRAALSWLIPAAVMLALVFFFISSLIMIINSQLAEMDLGGIETAGLVETVVDSGIPQQPSGLPSGTHQTISSPGFSYELYLPWNYSSERQYPLVICFSPNGNGADFQDSVYPVTNEYGYVLVGSNDFRNDVDSSIFLPRIYGSLADIRSRVNIDGNRIYACGFSGGGMASYVVSYFKPNYFQGLIVNSGSIHGSLYNKEDLRRMGVRKVVLICGRGDGVVSCEHMENDERWLNASGIETYFIEFDGGHSIAPQDSYIKAIEWLET